MKYTCQFVGFLVFGDIPVTISKEKDYIHTVTDVSLTEEY